MKIKVINKTPFVQYIDTDGDDSNPNTTVVLGPKATEFINIPNERMFLKLSQQLKDKVIFRKL